MKISKSKRLWFCISSLIANFIIVIFGMKFHADLVALGTCLMMINTPLYVYVLGETMTPSKKKK